MRTPANRVVCLAAAAVLTATACTASASNQNDASSGDEDAQIDTPTSATDGSGPVDDANSADGEPAGGTEDADAATADAPAVGIDELDSDTQTMITNVAAGYKKADGIWDGFVPNEHPTVLVMRDGDSMVTGAVAINHPDPDALGTATPVKLDGLPFTSLHRIADPSDLDALQAIEAFDFHAQLGGVDSFAMIASPGAADGFFDPTKKDYVSTLLHEMFHRYQDETFEPLAGQDIEGYAYTAENLELAVLEERALSQAIEATEDEDRRSAARRFAAIRLTRIALDGRAELDNSQEMFEGTARYIEHRLADTDEGFVYHAGNYGTDLVTGFEKAFGVKETFGFGRWYASGAAGLRILDLLGVDGVAGRVEAGESPAEILANALDVTEANREELLSEARGNYDPLGGLAGAAADAEESAKNEPPVFDDGPTGEAGGEIELSDSEVKCLEDLGVDLSGTGQIPDEQWDACVA